ncbi:MAG: osmotically inducible protein OsmC [Pseudomonadota bacterium]
MSVSVQLTRDADGKYTAHLGSAALPTVTWDPAALTPEQRQEEHMGARLLLLSALACYVNTLAADLMTGGAQTVGEINATADITKEKGSNLRTRFTSISINVETPVAPADQAAFTAARNGLLNGSLVTYSLEEEIELDYNIEAL